MKLKTPHVLFFTMSLLTVLLFSACEQIIDPPQESITVEQAKILQNEFITTRAGIINDSLNIIDTRDIWFSLDTLKKYITYVEQQGERLGKENLGIRIYFAAYPDEPNYPDPGYATVFLVPTALEESPLKSGFFPVQPVNQNIDGLNALNYGTGGIPPNDL